MAGAVSLGYKPIYAIPGFGLLVVFILIATYLVIF